MSNLTDTTPSDILAKVETSDMIHWSDDRRKEFCNTFMDRTSVGRYILLHTAQRILTVAQERKYISYKHVEEVHRKVTKTGGGYGITGACGDLYDPLPPRDRDGYYHHGNRKVGGREPQELNTIAEQRAAEVLKALPPLKKAIEIIDADTAKLIDAKEKILAAGRKIKTELDEVTEDIDIDDVDAKMTMGAFRDMVRDRAKRAKALAQKLIDLSEEGTELEKRIAKRLYAGLPGLSDAVVEAVIGHVEQAIGLTTLNRRVAEQVKFGDSEAAVDLLRHFEKDETRISDDVQTKFAAAMDKLKASMKKPAAAKKTAKALKA